METGFGLGRWIRHHAARRPWWMNALLLFCAWMTFVYVPWDLFVKPAAVDEEVWLGLRFHGAWAKALAVPHWAVYAAGLVGFWGMRRWMWPWAAVYAGQVALSMLVWPLLYEDGVGPVLGGVVAAGLFSWLAVSLWRARERFQPPGLGLRERYGEWAVVTGASAGIGTAFARALAAEGVSVVLAARRTERLRELAQELEKRHGVATRVVGVDLARAEGPELLLTTVEDLDVAILVNNAGIGYAGRLDGQDPERLAAIVQLNCATPVVLTARLLPAMRTRGRGAVVVVGSVSGSQPLALHALYAATKVFDNYLGEALWGELQGTGVDALALLPGSTETEFQEVSGSLPHHGEAPEKVVATALRALGHQPSVISGGFNWIRANAGTRLLPRSWLVMGARAVIARQTPPEKR